jgi:MFS family permease
VDNTSNDRGNEGSSQLPEDFGQVGTDTAPIDTHVPRRTVIYASVVAFLAWAFAVYDYILFGTLLPEISAEFGWTPATGTAVVTIVAIGTFLVAVLVGPMIDYFGRKNSLIVCTIGAGLSSGLTALTPSGLTTLYLTIVRSIAGLGYSEQAVNTTYLNELYGDQIKRRGLVYSLVQGGWPIGVLLASGISALLIPLIGWRGAFLFATVPSILVIFLATKLRESPKYQAMVRVRKLEREGRHAEALTFGANYGIDPTNTGESTLRQIFEPDIRRHTIFLSLAFLANWIGIQVFAVLGTTVLTEGKGVEFSSALVVLVVSNAAAYIGYLTHGFFGDLIGRRMTIAGGWTISGIAYTLMLFGPDSGAVVLTLYTIGLFFIIGPYAALLFFMGESFPTRVRGTGASFVNAMGPLGAIAGSGLLSATLALGASMTTAAFVVGAIAVLVSGVLMLGTRNVTDPNQAEAIAGGASPRGR